jgi:hypothetical protein
MAVGVAIGLVVNFAAFPPLHFWDAQRRITETNEVISGHLEDLAESLRDDRPDPDRWIARQHRLDREMADVRERLAAAEESKRANPRAIRGRNRRRLVEDAARFRALERVAWYTSDLTEIVGTSGPVSEQLGWVGPQYAERLAVAVCAVAEVVRGDGADALDEEAVQAIRAVESAMDAGDRNRPSEVTLTSAATVALRGIIESERRATG